MHFDLNKINDIKVKRFEFEMHWYEMIRIMSKVLVLNGSQKMLLAIANVTMEMFGMEMEWKEWWIWDTENINWGKLKYIDL